LKQYPVLLATGTFILEERINLMYLHYIRNIIVLGVYRFLFCMVYFYRYLDYNFRSILLIVDLISKLWTNYAQFQQMHVPYTYSLSYLIIILLTDDYYTTISVCNHHIQQFLQARVISTSKATSSYQILGLKEQSFCC
jgi:hypothetical protein